VLELLEVLKVLAAVKSDDRRQGVLAR